MTIKKRLSVLITAAMAMALSAGDDNYGSGNIKKLKAPRRPNIPKTPADYEAMHVAEMKRRRKAKTRLRNQHNQEA